MTGDDTHFFLNEGTWPAPPPPAWDDTAPIPYAQCPDCLAGTHMWSDPGAETFPGTPGHGTHTVLRHRCDCDICFGRCDARRTTIRATAHHTATARHASPDTTTTDQQQPHELPDNTLPHRTRTKEGPDAVPEPRRSEPAWPAAGTPTRRPTTDRPAAATVDLERRPA